MGRNSEKGKSKLQGKRSQPALQLSEVVPPPDDPKFAILETESRSRMVLNANASLLALNQILSKSSEVQKNSPVYLGRFGELTCMVKHFMGNHSDALSDANVAVAKYNRDYSFIRIRETFLVVGEQLILDKDYEKAKKLCEVALRKFEHDTELEGMNAKVKAYYDAIRKQDEFIAEIAEAKKKTKGSIGDSSSSIPILPEDLDDKAIRMTADEDLDDKAIRMTADEEKGNDKDISNLAEPTIGYKLSYDKGSGRGSMRLGDASIAIRLLHIEQDDMTQFDAYHGLCSSDGALLSIIHVVHDPDANTYVAIAEDYYSFAEYLHELMQRFSQECDQSKKAWGRFIATRVREIFGEAAETLMSLYDKGRQPFGNLETLLIGKDGKARIQPSMSQESNGKNDVSCFLSLMRRMLSGPFDTKGGYDDFDFPMELMHFLLFCSRYKDSLPAKYVLHHPFFWRVPMKLFYPQMFINTINIESSLFRFNTTFEEMDKDLEFKDWKDKLEGVYVAIWSYGNPEKEVPDLVEEYIKDFRLVEVSKYSYTASIVRYFSNAIDHVNDYKFRLYRSKDTYSDSEVLADLTRLYPTFYTLLYESAAVFVSVEFLANCDGLFGIETKKAEFPEL